MLASSAPAESETMLDVASASRPDPETCVAHTHTVVAATNWSTATKLAVSYTHLDVYKRQGWLGQEFGLVPAVAVMGGIVAAVSFTAPVSPLRGRRDLPDEPTSEVLAVAEVPEPAWQDVR